MNSLMESNAGLGERVVGATKWSVVTQLASKLISPITTIVLARILAPEAIGIVSLVTMVTSFADLFSDAGFHKYLIQHDFEGDSDYRLCADVAFWTNLVISLLLWAGIALFRDQIALLVGNDSIGLAIAVASGSLPLTAAVSVQTAVYQRSLDFKTLFYSRVGSSLLILFASVPLALAGLSYWSMIIGTLASNLFLAVWLTARSEWKPRVRYSFVSLKAMFSFSWWTLLESFSIWLTSWVGTFILGNVLSERYLGFYNTSTSLVNSIIGIVTSAINPVVFSSLSRLQGERERFDTAFYSMQKALGMCVVPMAAALFVFSDFAIELLLGSAWMETSTFFGLYGLASALVVVFCHTASDAYRALGLPRLSMLAQLGFLVVLAPSLYFGAKSGYEVFSVVVPFARVVGFVSVHFLICHAFVGLSPLRMLSNLRWVYLATLVVAIPASLAVGCFGGNMVWQIALIVLCCVAYCFLLFAIKDLRSTLAWLLDRFGITSLLPRRIANLLGNNHAG